MAIETIDVRKMLSIGSYVLLGGSFHFNDYVPVIPRNLLKIDKTTTENIWFLSFVYDEKGRNYCYTNTANLIRILNVIQGDE